MVTIDEIDEQLNKEKGIIKDLLLSRVNNDGDADIFTARLKAKKEIIDALLRTYFSEEESKHYDYTKLQASNNHPIANSGNKVFYDCYYKGLEMLREQDEYTWDLFVFDYRLSKRLLEVIDWFFSTIGDTKHDKETLFNLVAVDPQRHYTFRRELTNEGLKLPLEKKMQLSSYDFVLRLVKQRRLDHEYRFSNIEKIKDAFNINDERAISGTLLFHRLNMCAYISLAKEYGYSIKDLELDKEFIVTKKSMLDYILAKGDTESIVELENLIPSAEELSNRFINEKLL